MRLCSEHNCNTKHFGRGFCKKHYNQFMKHGKTFTITSSDFNEIVDKGSYFELVLTNKSMEEVGRAKIDKEDLDKLKSIGRWSLDKKGYVCNGKISHLKMHRVVMNAEDGEEVDHKKVGFKFKRDNRKKNLRICTSSDNNKNRSIRSDNKSGYKGVCWNKSVKKWHAQICVNGSIKSLGFYLDPKEAALMYQKAAKKFFKEFANF